MVNYTRSANFKHIIWKLRKTCGNEPPTLLLQSVTCYPRYCYRAFQRPAVLNGDNDLAMELARRYRGKKHELEKLEKAEELGYYSKK